MNEEDPKVLPFHYNRERRLEHASEAVRRSYEEGNIPKGGFIRGLTANAGMRSIFMIIILLCGAIVFLTFFGEPAGTTIIDGVQVKLKAFLYEETVYITLSCTGKNTSQTELPTVLASLTALDPDGIVVFKKDLSGVYRGEELILRTTMNDYELKTVNADVKFNKTDIKISVTVDRK